MTKLTLKSIAHLHTRAILTNDNEAIEFTVLGLPPGQEAWVANFDHRWQILRSINGVQGDWTGTYSTADEALAALRAEFPE